MSEMFCFQCEQVSNGVLCQNSKGACGKTADTSQAQDDLTAALIDLARVIQAQNRTPNANEVRLFVDGSFTCVTNVNFDDAVVAKMTAEVKAAITAAGGDAVLAGQATSAYDLNTLWTANEDIRSLKSLILLGMRGVAAYAHHAAVLGKNSAEVDNYFAVALAAIANPDLGLDVLIPMTMEVGQINLKAMEILYESNTGAYGKPAPITVTQTVEPGPFIVISGHDLHDLKLLLEQTEGTGVNVYTHTEMLPAHAYPELKRYPQLKGNFGTAWQNQQKEFDGIPAPILFTTNCLMPPRASYADRVFTTSVVAYPELSHIATGANGEKDFSAVIACAKALGGYAAPTTITGINGGTEVTTGFGHDAVLGVADVVIDAVKGGAIKHFFLVGGCDGAKTGRNYFTDFVKQAPADTVILTLACGKFRFNDLNIGNIGPLPRILDMGQCNDAYSAIQVALALAGAFECGVNDLPLSIVCSWYEQKAVAILLTLLSLGIKNILLGPSLPAFVSPTVLNFLVENFNIAPISTPEADLQKILG
ncbi:MAG: hydroxylamine reductase [Coriobacteriia bacterium]|nr:hydroxylamine reductase [Coriobacteriia bacterium]